MIVFKTELLARCLGLTTRRVRQLRDEGVFFEIKPGMYEPEKNIRAYIEYITRGSGDTDYFTERALLIKAKREKAEMELSEFAAKLHPAEDVERVITAILTKFKSKMMSIPSKISALPYKAMEREDLFKSTKDYIYEALDELSDYDALFGGDNGEEDS